MRITVLGGLGRQGSVIARNLIKQSPLYQVSIADSAKFKTGSTPAGMYRSIQADLSDYDALKYIFEDCELVVCSLPASLGYQCVKAAVDVGVNMVDLSFASEDLSVFDQEAKDKGLTIITDAGVDPGLSNLITGRAMLKGPNSIETMAGGIPQNPNLPFGYTITWSVDDLMEEYIRPARILVDGTIQTVPGLSGIETFGMGEDYDAYESFYTDNLRSMLVNNGGVPNLSARTLRWNGHIKAINPYLTSQYGSDHLKHEINKRCGVNDPDILIMRIKADEEEVTMVTPSNKDMSAMARTTALSCATFAALVADGTITRTGILPLEKLADDDKIYKAVLDKLETYGVKFSTKYPFI